MNLRGPDEIEAAVVARLKDWMPYMLAVAEQERGYDCGQLPRLRGIVTNSELAKWPEDQLPLAVVVSPGTIGEPWREGAGAFHAEYSVGVSVLAGAATEQATRDVALIYGAAIRGAILFRRSLGAQMHVTGFRGESLDEFETDKRRTLFGTLNLFAVELGDLVSWKQGPIGEPPEDPCAAATEWIAREVDITAERKQ